MANCTSSSRLLKSDTAQPKIPQPHVWESRTTTQAAQKGRPARPQRVKARGVPSWYVEGLNDARTTLVDFFSSLQGLRLVSHRLIQLRQARDGQRELRLHLDARRHQERRMEDNIADRDLELRLLRGTQFD